MSKSPEPTLEPKLDRPGAGLPIPFRWIARFLVPYRAKRSDWAQSMARFQRYSKTIEGIATQLTESQLNQRVLVEPIPGLEDSSRYWSVGMVLDHLVIAGKAFQMIIHELSHGRVPPIEVRVEKVKPPVEQRDAAVIARFNGFWTNFESELKPGSDSHHARLRHPWFGELNAHEWLFVHSVHFGVHLQQVKKITEKLS